jgi:hypothetical protein
VSVYPGEGSTGRLSDDLLHVVRPHHRPWTHSYQAHAIGTRLPAARRLYTTLEYNRQMTTSSAHGEKQCV